MPLHFHDVVELELDGIAAVETDRQCFHPVVFFEKGLNEVAGCNTQRIYFYLLPNLKRNTLTESGPVGCFHPAGSCHAVKCACGFVLVGRLLSRIHRTRHYVLGS